MDPSNDNCSSSLVSVILPTYNRSKTLIRCIESVLAQTYINLELIVVDDGSVDDSERLVTSIDDRRLRLIKHKRNRGQSVALNTGIKSASGEWIAIQDSDDEWLPQKLQRQMEVLSRDADETVAGICGRTQFINGKGEAGKVFPRRQVALSKGVKLEDMLLSNPVCHPSVIIRRDIFDKVGYYDVALMKAKDRDLFIRILQSYRLLGIDEILMHSYVADVNITKSLKPESLWLVLEKNSEVYGGIPRRCLADKYFHVVTEFMRLNDSSGALKALSRCYSLSMERRYLMLSKCVHFGLLPPSLLIFPYRVVRRLKAVVSFGRLIKARA